MNLARRLNNTLACNKYIAFIGLIFKGGHIDSLVSTNALGSFIEIYIGWKKRAESKQSAKI